MYVKSKIISSETALMYNLFSALPVDKQLLAL